MPVLKGKVITPQEAISKGLCPETGKSLKGVNIEHHIQNTWHGELGPEAKERVAMLRDFAKENPAMAEEEAD